MYSFYKSQGPPSNRFSAVQAGVLSKCQYREGPVYRGVSLSSCCRGARTLVCGVAVSKYRRYKGVAPWLAGASSRQHLARRLLLVILAKVENTAVEKGVGDAYTEWMA